MKRYSIVIAAATALLTLPAGAADLPRKAPAYVPPAPPPFTWTGFYAGIHAGWGWSDTSADIVGNIGGVTVFDPASLGLNSNGVVGGIQVGYNWQFAPNWVLGIEGDISGTGIHDTVAGPAVTIGGVPLLGLNHFAERDVRWLASIRGRLGWAADRWLLYVTGGGAWAGFDFTFGPDLGVFGGPGLFTGDKTRSGWTAGGGVEYAFTNNWTGRIEYLFYDLGDITNTRTFLLAGVTPLTTTTTVDTQINVVRLGVNYKF
jgi:outer membrane immunogenic protein